MVKIIDASIQKFYDDIQNRRLFLFGAGKRVTYICETYGIESKIEAIVDNNDKLVGDFFSYGKAKIPIVDIGYLVKAAKNTDIDQIVLLITPVHYCLSIIEQLDAIPAFEKLRCYVGRLLDDYYEKKDFLFSDGENIIPKKIHYCWFGKKEIPEHLRRCIDTWKEKCSDYEIIKWDETNYDITKNQYMKEAYECKKWGFVPDYARIDIVYNEGGIYLDTDVEIISSLDTLLKDEMFCGFNCYGLINFGLGFGAVPRNQFIKELRDAYDGKSFYNADKSVNLTACSWYQHPVFKKHGFQLNNCYQNIEGIVIYPSEVFAPTGASGTANNFSEKTVSIHHAELSWVTEQEKKEYERTRKNLKERISVQHFFSD